MEVDKLPLDWQPHVLVDVISAGVDICVPREGVELALHVDPGVPLDPVLIDSTRLSQVVFNLVNNALKFTTHGHVHVIVKSLGRTSTSCGYRVTVEDTGPGTPTIDTNICTSHILLNIGYFLPCHHLMFRHW